MNVSNLSGTFSNACTSFSATTLKKILVDKHLSGTDGKFSSSKNNKLLEICDGKVPKTNAIKSTKTDTLKPSRSIDRKLCTGTAKNISVTRDVKPESIEEAKKLLSGMPVSKDNIEVNKNSNKVLNDIVQDDSSLKPSTSSVSFEPSSKLKASTSSVSFEQSSKLKASASSFTVDPSSNCNIGGALSGESRDLTHANAVDAVYSCEKTGQSRQADNASSGKWRPKKRLHQAHRTTSLPNQSNLPFTLKCWV